MGKDQELLQAVKTEDLLTVQKLLQRPKAGKSKLLGSAKKVNVNIQDIDGFAPLHHAALSGNLELISLLLESQAAVDVRDQKGMRPLHYAAWQGRLEPMKMLLKSGSSVNGQSDEGQIPLHLAAQHGHYDVSEMLLQHQSNPCIVDNSGKTPLDLACEFGRVAVVQLLLNSNMCAALLEPKPGDPNGTSPLHLAAKNGHIDIIRLLIQAGIDINRQTKAGTALHEAALCGKTDVVRLLLDSGINASVRNTYSQTALDIVHQFTATQASKEIKQMLREASTTLQVRGLKDYCNNYDLTSLSIKAGDVITVLEQHPDGRWKGCIHDNRTGNDRVGFFPSSVVEVISKRAGSWNTVICTQQYQKIQLCAAAGGPPAVVNGDSYQYHALLPPPPPPPHSHQPLFTSFGYSRSQLSAGQLQGGQGSRGSDSSPHGSPSPTTGPQGSASEEIWVLRKPTAVGDRSSVGSSGSVASARSSGSGQSAGSSSQALHAQAEGVKLLATVLSQSTKAKEHLLEQSKSLEQNTALSSRSQGSSSCPLHEQQPHGGERKGEVPSDGKSADAVLEWLSAFQLQVYAPNFISEGYDMFTISQMTAEDLTAIGVTKPGHRKKMTSEISKMSSIEWHMDHKPADLAEWLSMVGLGQYYQVLVQNGYENIDFIANITWEDLQEIGITKLGHQKKLMLAVKKLAEFQKGPEGRKKKAPQSAEIMAIQSPPPDTGGGVSPKLTTFQDSELSGELQAALAPVDRQQGTEGKARARSATSRSQEEAGIMTGPPKKEARSSRQSSQGTSRVSVPSAQAKQRQYTSPQTPTKVKPSSPQSTGPAQSKGKGTPHAIVMPTEQPTSLPVVPQSPTHRGKVHTESQDSQVAPPPSLAPSTAPATVPLLCLPPEEDESVQGQSQRRARSLSRHAASDSEEQAGTPDGGLHPGMGRSTPSPASSPGQADKNVNRSHSFARPRKKGPPPPPPKRSSSAISSTNLSDEPKEEPRPSGALLDVNYRPQRRASDLGGAVDTGSAGSVRSIAAMLEMSSIGGGAKARVMQKSPVGQNFLQVHPDQAHPAVQGGGKPRDAIGLDGEVVNRRRTISGPVTELVAAARREKGPREAGTEPEPQPEKIQAEGKPSRQGKGENGHEMVLPQEEESSNADTALRRSSRARSQGEGVRFQLIESSTVKRRPKSRDKDSEEEPQDGPVSVPAPCQNGTVTTKRRPISEVAVTEPAWARECQESAPPHRDSLDLGSQAPEIRKPAKPPVSPKPVLAHHLKKQGGSGSSSKSVPLPGPESPEVKRVPPPVSPKPAPPPTAPKPSKVHIIPHGIGVTPGLSSAPYVARIASTPTPPSQSPQSSQPPGPPAPAPIPTPTPTPPPAKPPRSSISGVSLDGGGGVEAVQQRLEETSASLAAALQAVEEKIRKEDGLKDNAASEEKSTVSILDDIGSMFDDLADQLDAMLE
ncbi:LOW QUALITY PROTEIN: caskin-1-like [Scleropages formosus]|uniref:LOW QUALITY PROTEIN: caskin-1-like n=1 Tax=Scleropages formosus TaxID=113540 RepID=UPI000878C400|nr:LOW QUALITY PROTEIN: caskin-1-like [Scleropages formosus]